MAGSLAARRCSRETAMKIQAQNRVVTMMPGMMPAANSWPMDTSAAIP